MLVLMRKAGESITIGDGIVVKVIKVDGRQVQIGIEAPKSVPIHRDNAVSREPRHLNTPVAIGSA